MIAQAFVLSMIVGLIRRGRISKLSHVPLRHSYLFVMAFASLFAAYWIDATVDGPNAVLYVRSAHILQYAILFTAVGLNLSIYGMRIAGLGTLSNLAVIAANRGVMPVSEWALRVAGLPEFLKSEHTQQFVRHAIMSPDTRLWYLSDIIPMPGFGLMISQVASIGDVLVSVGVFILIQHYMCAPADKKAQQPV